MGCFFASASRFPDWFGIFLKNINKSDLASHPIPPSDTDVEAGYTGCACCTHCCSKEGLGRFKLNLRNCPLNLSLLVLQGFLIGSEYF